MKLSQNKVEAAEVLSSSKYNISGAWDVYGDKQKNKHWLTKELTVKGQTVNCRSSWCHVFGSGVLQEEDQLGYTAKLIEVDMEAKESILRQKVVDLYL